MPVSTSAPCGEQAEAAVSVSAVHKSFGANRALNGVSFSVTRGSIFAVLGPNGAGKTTTIEICEGFLRADSGDISVLGLDPFRQAASLRPRVGVMLQSGGAHGGARTREALNLVATCSRQPHDVDELLEIVGLASAAHTPVRRLSGGQVQRLSLAMALIGRPELLFLDEPTAGMDPQARRLVWDLLQSARSAGVTAVLSTHLLDEVEVLADEVLIIDHGCVVAQGSPGDIAGGASLMTFRSSAGLDLTPLAGALPAGTMISESEPGCYVVTGMIPADATTVVTRFLTGHDAPLYSLELRQRTLEDAYLDLTGHEVRL